MNDMAHMLTLTVSAALATGALTFPVTMPGGLHEAREGEQQRRRDERCALAVRADRGYGAM